MLLSEHDVALFAEAGGDRNPLHRCEYHARRTPFGRTVAHGVLAALATLEEHGPPATRGVSAVEADFGNPVYPGVRYRSRTLEDVPAGTGYRLFDGDRPCLTVRLSPGSPPAGLSPLPAPGVPTASLRAIGNLPPGTTVTGEYGPGGAGTVFERFPAATARLGRFPVLCLMWASMLAGMRLPGERCLLGQVALRFPPAGRVAATGPVRLSYTARVVHTDPRFGLVSIEGELTADGEVVAHAGIEAMVRAPAPLPTAASVTAHLPPSTRLLGRTAVVVGGSRGLGAALSLALASQGCDVYVGHRGATEPGPPSGDPTARPDGPTAGAARLPGRLHSVPGDASDPCWSDALRSRLWRDHGRLDFLVCSAAPPLRTLALTAGDLERVDEFLVGAVRLVSAPLAGLLDLLDGSGGRCLVISSAVMSEPPRDWPHYVAAKSAVEGLVRWAARHHPGVTFVLARPGMLRTEQTNSPVARETAGPVEPVAARLVGRLLDAQPAGGAPHVVEDPPGSAAPRRP
ncbi:MAG TPA: SDR family NAD(P)-dependent oxidoreductase [Streptomyces sp.]|nr:SDR family NAD(P)-dependent oxidoreductase [Streptomyces sp.]